jgi:hypothetical protein
VDVLGLLLTVLVTTGGVQDRDAAKSLRWNLRRAFPTVKFSARSRPHFTRGRVRDR